MIFANTNLKIKEANYGLQKTRDFGSKYCYDG